MIVNMKLYLNFYSEVVYSCKTIIKGTQLLIGGSHTAYFIIYLIIACIMKIVIVFLDHTVALK